MIQITTWFNHVTNGHPFLVAVFIPHTRARARAHTVYYIYWRKRKKRTIAIGNTIAYHWSRLLTTESESTDCFTMYM